MQSLPTPPDSLPLTLPGPIDIPAIPGKPQPQSRKMIRLMKARTSFRRRLLGGIVTLGLFLWAIYGKQLHPLQMRVAIAIASIALPCFIVMIMRALENIRENRS